MDLVPRWIDIKNRSHRMLILSIAMASVSTILITMGPQDPEGIIESTPVIGVLLSVCLITHFVRRVDLSHHYELFWQSFGWFLVALLGASMALVFLREPIEVSPMERPIQFIALSPVGITFVVWVSVTIGYFPRLDISLVRSQPDAEEIHERVMDDEREE